ncbi:unnamed protein product [Pleuronectes platessa]|uniref:Uncharacterized protein n=1 Tax=Pleuronectes platessa TaxID=8262 RepID=A0A9N7YQP6_PLEPL|nr:unnamed protein product [Pleuronectes platessa]
MLLEMFTLTHPNRCTHLGAGRPVKKLLCGCPDVILWEQWTVEGVPNNTVAAVIPTATPRNRSARCGGTRRVRGAEPEPRRETCTRTEQLQGRTRPERRQGNMPVIF